MQKKLLLVLLAVVSIGSLTACGNSAEATANAADEPIAMAEQEQDGVYEPNYADKKTMLAAAEAMEPVSADAGTVGSKVPEFTLHTYDGGTFGTKDMQGKVTLLVFFFPT